MLRRSVDNRPGYRHPRQHGQGCCCCCCFGFCQCPFNCLALPLTPPCPLCACPSKVHRAPDGDPRGDGASNARHRTQLRGGLNACHTYSCDALACPFVWPHRDPSAIHAKPNPLPRTHTPLPSPRAHPCGSLIAFTQFHPWSKLGLGSGLCDDDVLECIYARLCTLGAGMYNQRCCFIHKCLCQIVSCMCCVLTVCVCALCDCA